MPARPGLGRAARAEHGRVKEVAGAAAEAALQDNGMPTAEDEHVPSVVELLEETPRLADQIMVLTSGSDDKAEIAKWHRLYEDASRKQGEYGNRTADLERELKRQTRHLREIDMRPDLAGTGCCRAAEIRRTAVTR